MWLFLVFVCLVLAIAANDTSPTYIRFINKTIQVYMNKDMAEINADIGFNILGNSSTIFICLIVFCLFVDIQITSALSLNI